VFAELGETIANSIAAVEARQALHADTAVELELSVPDSDDVLTRIATACDCTVEYEGLAARSAEGCRLFLSAEATPESVAAALEDLVAVVDYQLLEDGTNRTTVEVVLSGDVLPARLVRHGASPRSLRATPTALTAVVHVPTSTDVREFLSLFGDPDADVDLVSRRTVTRSVETRADLLSSLFDPLTDRQLEVLATAYRAGYFEWPRANTGEDVAAMLDVSQPTVNRHLRNALRRLLDECFESGVPSVE
jgi:DNA-binding NarL/FixJ family response regulator